MDDACVRIGDNVCFGPNVSLMATSHPLIAQERMGLDDDGRTTMAEYARGITIGSNVWIACNATVIGGVTIGDNVNSIRKKTFAGCKKLKKITIKSKKLASVGAKAFKGISKNATIKTPKAKKKAYAKLLKNKGQAKSVKIR